MAVQAPLNERSVDFARLLPEAAFVADPYLVRVDPDKASFLRYKIDRQIVCLLANNHEFGTRSIGAVD